jgi:hypothetical protein
MAAAFGVASKLLVDGDKIGARMAFKENYSRLMVEARVAMRPIRWIVSLGWDKNDRVRALSEAVSKKHIQLKEAMGLLGPEQQDELMLALPPSDRTLLVGESKPSQAQLAGLPALIAKLAEQKRLPEALKPSPAKPEPRSLSRQERQERKQQLQGMARRLLEEEQGHPLSDEEIEHLKHEAANRVAWQAKKSCTQANNLRASTERSGQSQRDPPSEAS